MSHSRIRTGFSVVLLVVVLAVGYQLMFAGMFTHSASAANQICFGRGAVAVTVFFDGETIDVYAITDNDSGEKVLSFSQADIAALPALNGKDLLMGENDRYISLQLYRSANGFYRLTAGPDGEGKHFECIFDNMCSFEFSSVAQMPYHDVMPLCIPGTMPGVTPSITSTVSGSASTTPSETPSAFTATPSETPSGFTATPSETPSAFTATPSETPSAFTATPTETYTNTYTPPTVTPTDTYTNTYTPPTVTPTDTYTNTPLFPTFTPTNTSTSTPTSTPTYTSTPL